MSTMDVAVGIDVAEARKGLDLVALDGDHRVVAAHRRCTLGDVVAVIAELRPDVVCIDSPPAWSAVDRSRTAERELRRFGITAFSTPTDPGDHAFYRWMRVGFSIFDAIAADFPRYRSGSIRRTAAEVFPEATAVLLRGHLRPSHESKSAFRRAVLTDHAVDHTRLESPDAVDAALAALTGVLALAGTFSTLGDPAEGVIVLPVAALPTARLVRAPLLSSGGC
jgi:predicted nuclease with RNAse H fold